MSVKFRGSLAECLRFGHVLEICGKVKEDAKRFHISLSTGDSSSLATIDIGLFISIDFDTNIMTLKKRLNNEWCDVQSRDCETAKLLRKFQIYIVIADEKFHISLNKVTAITSKYRLRLSLLNFIEIDGDLDCIYQVDHRKYFPYCWPPIQVVEEHLNFSNDVPMPFKAGHVMVISVQLRGNPKGRFVIHLRNVGDCERQELHFSVRFDTKTIARNSKTIPDGEHYDFGEEERDEDFPFDDFQRPFKLAIAFTDKGLQFAKDGLFWCNYLYRTFNVLPSIGGLKIFGIRGVQVEVSGMEHIQMEDSLCNGFEMYTKL